MVAFLFVKIDFNFIKININNLKKIKYLACKICFFKFKMVHLYRINVDFGRLTLKMELVWQRRNYQRCVRLVGVY